MGQDPVHLADQPGAASVLFGLVVLAGIAGAYAWLIRRTLQGRDLLPRGSRRIVPWGPWSLLAVVAVYLLLGRIVGSSMLVPPAGTPEGAAWRPDSEQAMTFMVVLNAIAAPAIVLVLKRTSGASMDQIGLQARGAGRELLEGSRMALVLAPVSLGLMQLLTRVWGERPHDLETMVRTRPGLDVAVLAVVSGVILAPLTEELLFRGVLLPWLQGLFEPSVNEQATGPRNSRLSGMVEEAIPEPRQRSGAADAGDTSHGGPPKSLDGEGEPGGSRQDGVEHIPEGSEYTQGGVPLGWVWPNLVSSAVFAGMHAGQWPAPAPLFILSLGLGWVTIRTGRIWAAIGLHAAFNGLSTMVLVIAALEGGLGGVKARGDRPAAVPGFVVKTPDRTASTAILENRRDSSW